MVAVLSPIFKEDFAPYQGLSKRAMDFMKIWCMKCLNRDAFMVASDSSMRLVGSSLILAWSRFISAL